MTITTDRTTKILLVVIAALLAVLVFRPLFALPVAFAAPQTGTMPITGSITATQRNGQPVVFALHEGKVHVIQAGHYGNSGYGWKVTGKVALK